MTINRLLTDKDRNHLKPIIQSMWEYCPNVMRRKIDRANVQQAFVLNTVIDFIDLEHPQKKAILSVGCYDDTAYEYLVQTEVPVRGIDPQINQDLHSFYLDYKDILDARFDIIFSTSVLEHVTDDEGFLDDICKLLAPGGIGILTMDFNNDYRPGDKLPATDLRFYTKYDLEFRLTKVLTDNGCDLVDVPDWSGEPEFTHDGCVYSFSTFVFRKNKDVQ